MVGACDEPLCPYCSIDSDVPDLISGGSGKTCACICFLFYSGNAMIAEGKVNCWLSENALIVFAHFPPSFLSF